jgi:hypothetical protein
VRKDHLIRSQQRKRCSFGKGNGRGRETKSAQQHGSRAPSAMCPEYLSAYQDRLRCFKFYCNYDQKTYCLRAISYLRRLAEDSAGVVDQQYSIQMGFNDELFAQDETQGYADGYKWECLNSLMNSRKHMLNSKTLIMVTIYTNARKPCINPTQVSEQLLHQEHQLLPPPSHPRSHRQGVPPIGR